MTPPTTSTVDTSTLRAELLDRLGLPADATSADVAAAHRAAKNLLANAPDDQKAWAADQLADVEAVCSLLDDMGPSGATGDAAATTAPAAASAALTARRRAPWWVWAAGGTALVLGAAFGIHAMTSSSIPGITGAPDTSTSASPSATIDQARVGQLMQAITANPKDVSALGELASIYFQGGDYKDSAIFSQKVVEIAPKTVGAWVALGAAQFNEGDTKGAEKSWLKAVALNPKTIEAHYDLGFLYLSAAKPDMAKVKAEWEKVVAIDPNSEIAKNVKTHLASLTSPSPAPSSSK